MKHFLGNYCLSPNPSETLHVYYLNMTVPAFVPLGGGGGGGS